MQRNYLAKRKKKKEKEGYMETKTALEINGGWKWLSARDLCLLEKKKLSPGKI